MAINKLRVLLADDHPVFRCGLKALIDAQHDMVVVGAVGNGRAAVAEARQLTPDVVVMDLSMPEMNGTRATERIKQDFPEVKVLVLTLHEEQGYLRRLLEAGASGYVLKQVAGEELILAIRAVVGGGLFLDPAMARKIVGSIPSQPAPAPGDQRSAALSARERAVLKEVAAGYSNKEIGQHLGVSTKTVETYRARLMGKLGLTSRAAIVRFALHQGWLDED